MLMMRPPPRAFMPGMTALLAWKADDRLIARMAFHFSTGNSSTDETNWMPALLTNTSTLPNVSSAPATIASISSGLVMSAGE